MADFDRAQGWLRRIRVGDREVVNAVYGAVRDRNWGTILPQIDRLHIDQFEDTFQVSFEARCVSSEADFCWRGEIIGEASGIVTFRFVGEAMRGCRKNRIGLCVLHPLERCAGRPCRIETVDGQILETDFPRLIAPHQPFKNVRAITYDPAPAFGIEVRFEGDVFETEDQRNWTDASFKTYSTPLAQPFPVWVEPGTRVEQTVRVRIVGARSAFKPQGPILPPVVISAPVDDVRALPPIGFGLARRGAALSEKEWARMRRLRPAHLRIDLWLGRHDWLTQLRQGCAEAAAIGASLHVALFLSDQAAQEFRALAAELDERPAPVSLWLVFHQDEPATRSELVRLAEAALPTTATFAAGTDANFAELNRARPEPTESALPCFSICPQVHAFDDASLIENLGAQPATIETARSFSNRAIVISPITLQPRFNAVAMLNAGTGAEVLPPPPVDARQMSLFGAAWTVGSLARLATLEGIHSLTYYQTNGTRGLMNPDESSASSERFESSRGCVFPMFHVFAWVAEAERIISAHSSDPLRFDGLCVVGRDEVRRWIVANLTPERLPVQVNITGTYAHVCVLDEVNVAMAMHDPENFAPSTRHAASSGSLDLELNGYAVAHITPEA